ncbi:hypothetical protein DW058_02575 [Clostridiaceae bacterium AF42-6]|nr:hypothetical protein DW058_02575 [Clostridiaceae bacterium AF42-6]
MFIKQISKDEALQLASKGQDILIMVPGEGDGSWNDMVPDTLQNLLAGLMFFRKEPALENQILEEDNTPPDAKVIETLRNLPEVPQNQPPTVRLPVQKVPVQKRKRE